MRSIIRGAFWPSFYRIVAIGAAFFISAVSAQLLGVDEYGVLQFVFSLAQIAQLCLGLGLPVQVLRGSGEEPFGHENGSLDLLIKRAIAIFLVLALCTIVPLGLLWLLVSGSVHTVLFFAACFYGVVQHIGSVYRSALVGKSRFAAAGFGDFFAGVSSLFVLSLILLIELNREFDSGAVLFIRSLMVAIGSLFLYSLWSRTRRVTAVRDEPLMERTATIALARTGFPIMLIGIGAVLNSSADIILLGLMRSSTEVGYYHVATRGAGLVLLPLTIIIIALSPMISRLNKKDISALKVLYFQATILTAMVALLIAVALIHLLDPFIGLFGSSFEGAAQVTIILIAVQVLNVSFGPAQHFLVMTGNQNSASRAMIWGVLTNVVCNFILIPQHGAVGAAIGTGLGVVIWNILSVSALRSTLFRLS